MNRNGFSVSDLQVKTFQIQSSSDEQALNEFLVGKMVRHWSATFTPSTSLPSSDGAPLVLGAWNVFVAYEIRQADSRPAPREQQSRQEQNRQGQHAPALQKRFPMQNSGPRQNAPAPRSPEKAPVREDYKPQVADHDFPLFDAIRKWRNTRAKEERVKPFAFFNNHQLEQVVTAKPTDAAALRAIASDMEPAMWEKYQNELLAFIETARSTAEVAAPVEAAPVEAAAE